MNDLLIPAPNFSGYKVERKNIMMKHMTKRMTMLLNGKETYVDFLTVTI